MLEFRARKNLKLFVTEDQMQIIVGSLLGDAYVSSRGQIQFEHTIKNSLYTNWLHQRLSNLAYKNITKVERYDRRYKKTYLGTRFWLRAYFRPLRKTFYPKGKKVFPKSYLRYLSPLAISIWFMDDGNYYRKTNTVKIATDSFDANTKKTLRDFLLEKYGIKTSIHTNGKMRISSDTTKLFFKIISPYIHSSMYYKIP